MSSQNESVSAELPPAPPRFPAVPRPERVRVIRNDRNSPYRSEQFKRTNSLNNLASRFLHDELKKGNACPTREQFLSEAPRLALGAVEFDPPLSDTEWKKILQRARKRESKLYGSTNQQANERQNGANPTPKPRIDPIPIQPTPERQGIWSRLESLIRANFHEPDIQAAQIILASVAAHRIISYPPAWNMAIAVAGSMKTVILESLDSLPDVYLIDEVTPQTFISGKIDSDGQERKTPASLLHRIGDQGILISADFSTVLTSDQRNRAKVFSQLRRIYDGHLHREFGSDENLDERDWKGRITFLAGVTPEVDRHHKVFAALGDRFVRVRWPRAGGATAALIAMQQNRQLSVDVKTAVRELMLPILSHQEIAAPLFPDPLLKRVANLSEFISRARAYVPRDGKTDQIDGEVQIESNTRLPQELSQIGRGWAALMNRPEVTSEDFELIRRAAFDSIPPTRFAVLKTLMSGKGPHTSGLPPATVERTLEDLQATGLVFPPAQPDISDPQTFDRKPYRLSDEGKRLLVAAGEEVVDPKFISGKVTQEREGGGKK